MELEETLDKIKGILEKDCHVKDVKFRRKTFDEKWPDVPYIGFNLQRQQDSSRLDKLLGFFQSRVLDGRTEIRTTYVRQSLTPTDSYREIPIVIKEGTAAEKQKTLKEVTEGFYEALEECLRFCRAYQEIKKGSKIHKNI